MIQFSKITLFVGIVLIPSFALADEVDDIFINAGWNSKYVSEGRDNLDTGGIAWTEVSASYGDLELLLYRGESDSTSYGEWNVGLAEAVSFGDFQLAISYTYLYFTEDRVYDNEFGVECMAPAFAGVEASLAVLYSTEADGAYGEIFMERGFDLGGQLSMTVHGILGANGGYVVGEPEGLNHAQLGVVMTYALREGISLNLSAHQSFGIADGVEDLSWFGVFVDVGGVLFKRIDFHTTHHE